MTAAASESTANARTSCGLAGQRLRNVTKPDRPDRYSRSGRAGASSGGARSKAGGGPLEGPSPEWWPFVVLSDNPRNADRKPAVFNVCMSRLPRSRMCGQARHSHRANAIANTAPICCSALNAITPSGVKLKQRPGPNRHRGAEVRRYTTSIRSQSALRGPRSLPGCPQRDWACHLFVPMRQKREEWKQ